MEVFGGNACQPVKSYYCYEYSIVHSVHSNYRCQCRPQHVSKSRPLQFPYAAYRIRNIVPISLVQRIAELQQSNTEILRLVHIYMTRKIRDRTYEELQATLVESSSLLDLAEFCCLFGILKANMLSCLALYYTAIPNQLLEIKKTTYSLSNVA